MTTNVSCLFHVMVTWQQECMKTSGIPVCVQTRLRVLTRHLLFRSICSSAAQRVFVIKKDRKDTKFSFKKMHHVQSKAKLRGMRSSQKSEMAINSSVAFSSLIGCEVLRLIEALEWSSWALKPQFFRLGALKSGALEPLRLFRILRYRPKTMQGEKGPSAKICVGLH